MDTYGLTCTQLTQSSSGWDLVVGNWVEDAGLIKFALPSNFSSTPDRMLVLCGSYKGISWERPVGFQQVFNSGVGSGGGGTGGGGGSGGSTVEPCDEPNPAVGQLCADGTYYIGNIGGVKYFTTPGGCGYEPGGNSTSSPSSDFTPTCSGTDSMTKTWNNGTSHWYDIPGITNYTSTYGTGYWSLNTDANSGFHNTAQMVAITSGSQGGLHAAAHYCDKLSYGSKTDWFLPNRYEIDLLRQIGNTLQATLDVATGTNAWYWSSSPY